MSNESGTLEKLHIYGFEDATANTRVGDAFIALINPSTISVDYGVNVKAEEEQDVATPNVKYCSSGSSVISFDLILDGTGVLGSNSLDVAADIELFKTNCYYYIGKAHEIPYVRIQWGAFIEKHKDLEFIGRLSSFKLNYSLFKGDGSPLRAKISASFMGTMEKVTSHKIQEKSSPDLTHIITVRAGDSLPMLCQKVYKDAERYHQVAKINKLTNFRKLIPGQQLEFPPISN